MAGADGTLKAGVGNTFRSDEGGSEYNLYYEAWSATGSPGSTRITVLFFHGVHESADTTTARRLASRCNQRGWNFVALEHHGHGRSSGHRGLVQSWALLEGHALAFVDHWAAGARDASGAPHCFFLMGHSMGGAVAARVVRRVDSRYGIPAERGVPRFLGQVLWAPALTCSYPGACTRGLLRAVGCVAPWAPLGPPEDVSCYDTGSGLNLNYSGKMQLRTATLFVDAAMEVEADIGFDGETIVENVDEATKSHIRQTLAFALALPGRPCLVLHGLRDHGVPATEGSVQHMVYAACIPADASDRRSRVDLIKGEDHQPIAYPMAHGAKWETYADSALDWVAQVVGDAQE